MVKIEKFCLVSQLSPGRELHRAPQAGRSEHVNSTLYFVYRHTGDRESGILSIGMVGILQQIASYET